MANPTVDKLKALGLRHGEKAVVGLMAAVALLCIVKAAGRPTIELTPAQVKSAAESASANINKRQDEADVLAKIEEAGIVNPNFEKMVNAQINDKLVAANYSYDNPWVTPEPGAGLIRDQPKLIAPTELVAHFGRGGALLFELDAEGKRIPDTGKDAVVARKERSPRARRSSSGSGSSSSGMSSMGSMMMSGGGGGAPLSKKDEEAQKKAQAEEDARIKRQLAGKVDPTKDTEKTEAEASAEPKLPDKEAVKGLRWVTLTGVLDNETLLKNYEEALKIVPAYPNFREVEVERQAKADDGQWTEWAVIDPARNNLVLDNIPEIDEELTAETARLETLVAPLPFLKAGYWEKVHVARLVPKEKRAAPKVAVGGMMGSSMGSRGSGSMMSPSMGGGSGSMMMSGGEDSMGNIMGGMGSGGGGSADPMNFPHSDDPAVMVRAIDFTVNPDETYRYRTRLVVFNPNKERDDVSPGVDTTSDYLFGPWSEPTNEVNVPADVATFAMDKLGVSKRDEVTYEVASFNPDDGVTVVRSFNAGPGQVIGEASGAQVPASDGTGIKSKMIDFTSRQVVLDAMGGALPIPQIGIAGMLDVPAVSLIVRADGAVVVRSQARDVEDASRVEMKQIYERSKADSNKKRDPGMFGGSMMMSPEG